MKLNAKIKVRIGIDGVRVDKWLGSKFIPYREVTAVEVAGTQPNMAVVLSLRDNDRWQLNGANEAVAQRIREAMATQTERRRRGPGSHARATCCRRVCIVAHRSSTAAPDRGRGSGCADDDLRIALEEAADSELKSKRIMRAMDRFGERD